MSGLYLFAAAAGVPLVLWFLLSAADDDSGADADGIGGVMLRLLPLSSIAIAMAAFGVAGLLLGAVGTASGTTFVAAIIVAVLAGGLNSAAFGYLRRSESTTAAGDEQVVGSVGRVVLPIAAGRRGRIAISVGGQQRYFSARAVPGETGGELEAGAPVLVVEVSGGVAAVTRLDEELT